MKYEYLAQPAGIMSPAFSRIAFCLYMLKFVGTSKDMRNVFCFIIATQLIVNLATMIEVLISCEQFSQLWDYRLHGRCWSPRIQAYLGFFQGAWNSTTDLVLTVLPIMILRNLCMERRTRIALCLIMGLSFLAMIACIVKTVELRALGDKHDFTFNTWRFVVWFTVEQYVVIIAASIPTIRPLALRLSQKWKNRTPRGTGRNSGQPIMPPQDQDGSNDLSWNSGTPPLPVRLNTPDQLNGNGANKVESPYVHPPPKSPPPLGTIRKTISVVIRTESVDENLPQPRGVYTTVSAGQTTPEMPPAHEYNHWPFPESESRHGSSCSK